jgi:FlaA1/EpsC-like NDP-sugar epimerase
MMEILLDMILVAAAYDGAVLLSHQFRITSVSVSLATARLPLLFISTYLAFFICRVYHGVWRYVGIEDLPRFGAAAALAAALVFALSRLERSGVDETTVVLYGILLFNLLSLTRLSLRLFSSLAKSLAQREQRILIVGTGATAESAARQVGQRQRVHLVGFVDEDPFKSNKLIYGRRVLGSLTNLQSIYDQTNFSMILIADDLPSLGNVSRVQRFAETHKIEIRRYLFKEESFSSPDVLSSGNMMQAD